MPTIPSIRHRTFAIRKHLNEMKTAAEHMDLKRMQSHKEIIEDHLHEIDRDCAAMRQMTERVLK